MDSVEVAGRPDRYRRAIALPGTAPAIITNGRFLRRNKTYELNFISLSGL